MLTLLISNDYVGALPSRNTPLTVNSVCTLPAWTHYSYLMNHTLVSTSGGSVISNNDNNGKILLFNKMAMHWRQKKFSNSMTGILWQAHTTIQLFRKTVQRLLGLLIFCAGECWVMFLCTVTKAAVCWSGVSVNYAEGKKYKLGGGSLSALSTVMRLMRKYGSWHAIEDNHLRSVQT